jgi:predicted deacylase
MRQLKRIPIATMASGMEAALHLHEITGGRGTGKTVGICAAIHGDEGVSTQMIVDLARQLDDSAIAGRVLLLPVANPFSFEANSRQSPIDDINLNRVFPGVAEGWFSEHLATRIIGEFLDKIDVLIDIHAGGRMPTVDYTYIFNDEDLSRAFGTKLLYRPKGGVSLGTIYGGTLSSYALERGMPTVTLELGGGVVDQAPYVARGLAGLQNMLRQLGTLPGKVERRADQVVMSEIRIIRPRQGGFLSTEAPPLGEPIAAGAVLGRVVSPYTFEELEVIHNPVPDGWMVLAHLSRNLVQPGDYGYMVGRV